MVIRRRASVHGEVVSTRIRLPAAVHDALSESADKAERSLNSEMLVGLKHWLSVASDTSTPPVNKARRKRAE